MTSRACQWAAPFLIALHLPIFLFATNVNAFLFKEAASTIAAAILVATLLVIIIHRITRNRGRTVCVAAGAIAWLCWYGIFADTLAIRLGIGPLAGGRVSAAVVPWTALWLLYTVVVIRARSLDVAASAWLLASLALLAQPLAHLGTFAVRRTDMHAAPPPAIQLAGPSVLPDVIHIIFDRYGSDGVLHTYYGFDNSPLAEQLRGRGFFVADRSNANYFKTGLSLAATLNYTYLNDRLAGLETVSDWRPIYRLLNDHAVWRSLKPLGYDYVHMGSWWEPTRDNPHASENHSYTRVSHFAHWAYRFTPLYGLGVSAGGILDARTEQWRRIDQQLRDLERIRRRRRPLYLFVHFLLPHEPYVFGPSGEFLPLDVVSARTDVENYVNHVRFANVAMIRVVDALMADKTRPTPIIIVQGDEGPFPPRYDADTLSFDWRQATSDELRQKFGILNAIYLPGVGPRGLHSAISPVNTYRVVFNEYFGAKLDLLPDRSFVSVGDRKPYQFIDITDIVAGRDVPVHARTSAATAAKPPP